MEEAKGADGGGDEEDKPRTTHHHITVDKEIILSLFFQRARDEGSGRMMQTMYTWGRWRRCRGMRNEGAIAGKGY